MWLRKVIEVNTILEYSVKKQSDELTNIGDERTKIVHESKNNDDKCHYEMVI